MRVAVTGASGRLGREAVEQLAAAGHAVHGLDLLGEPGPGFTRVDLGDYGEALDALLGVTGRFDALDAVVHLAAVPVNGLVPDASTYRRNHAATFDVLFAAHRARIDRVVLASSITAMGFPFEAPPPSLPVDESYTAAFTTYGLAKVADEAIAAQLASWAPGRRTIALRFTNIVGPGDYGTFDRAADPSYRRELLGSYIDVRDAGRAVVLALERVQPGFDVVTVAAPETGLDVPSAELARRWFPGVATTGPLEGNAPLVAVEKARRVLGFEARHLWREEHHPAAG